MSSGLGVFVVYIHFFIYVAVMMIAAPQTSGSLRCRYFMNIIFVAIIYFRLPAKGRGWVVPAPPGLKTFNVLNSGPQILPQDVRNWHYNRFIKLRRHNSGNGQRTKRMVIIQTKCNEPNHNVTSCCLLGAFQSINCLMNYMHSVELRSAF